MMLRVIRGARWSLVVLFAAAALEACSSVPATPQPLALASWTHGEYRGDGLAVRVTHPAEWSSQLQPMSIHYATTLAFLANFTLHQFCGPEGNSAGCTWANLGTFPPGGMLATIGTWSGLSGDQLLTQGTRLLLDGKRASEQTSTGQGCLGVGADHSLWVAIDGGARGQLTATFCWRGADPILAVQASLVARSLTISPDPTKSGPFPS